MEINNLKEGLNNFESKINATMSIGEQIEKINLDENLLSFKIDKTKRDLHENRENYNRYEQKLHSRYKLQDHEKKTIQRDLLDCENIVKTLHEALTESTDSIKKLREKKKCLQKDLSELSCIITDNDVLEFQKKVAAARKTVKNITEIIESKNALINNEKSVISCIKELTIKKEDILAEIALGKNLQKDLEKISQKITEEEKLLTNREQTISEIKKAMPGLDRKLSIATNNLKKLENIRNEILINYLMGEAEEVGKEYGDAASILIDKYQRLAALDSLIIKQGGKTISGSEFHDFAIPAFHLNVLHPLISPQMPQELVTARMATMRENKDNAITREIKRISDLGIEL